MNTNNDKDLERFIHEQLKALPERRAPRSLEHRVLQAIESRRKLPWWHRSFAAWPTLAKAAFVGGSIALISAAIGIDTSDIGIGTRLVQNVEANLRPLLTVANAVGNSGEALAKGIPSTWLYGGLAFIAMLYGSLFVLGATAYKTIISNR